MAAPAYTVRLSAFEGPLDLLLHLVRSNELDIYHLPIAQITDQYVAYISMFEELNLDVAGEYLLMAASLMYMKSRLLLPRDDEEEDEEDEAVADLVRQLAEYQRYREAADVLRDRLLLDRDVFRRQPTEPEGDAEEVPLRRLDQAALFEALRRVLVRAAARRPHTVSREEYSVSDAVRSMVGRLRAAGRMEFHELFDEEAPRGMIIATFLGLLELVKNGVIAAEQEGRFGPIWVRLLDSDVDDMVANLTDMYGPASASESGERAMAFVAGEEAGEDATDEAGASVADTQEKGS
ncbi:MAG: ScpA family protein [Candidatus Binatia bacterium]